MENTLSQLLARKAALLSRLSKYANFSNSTPKLTRTYNQLLDQIDEADRRIKNLGKRVIIQKLLISTQANPHESFYLYYSELDEQTARAKAELDYPNSTVHAILTIIPGNLQIIKQPSK